ncbi:MAG: hypothetical protein ACRD4Y_17445, partial [Candidatus Acidiferrales bacterium]
MTPDLSSHPLIDNPGPKNEGHVSRKVTGPQAKIAGPQTWNHAEGIQTLKKEPLSFTEWRDPKSSSVGWLVVDRRVNGVSGGGVFMWSGATLEETRAIAHTMSKKF